MYILIVNLNHNLMQLDIYKIYRSKKIVHELIVKITNINEKEIRMLISNSNQVALVNKSISVKSDISIDERLKHIFGHEKLIKYEFDYVVNKIKDGGAQYINITLLHSRTLSNLAKINDSPEQKLQLHIAEYLHQLYKKGKHYLCFETSFYSSVNNSLQSSVGFSVNRELGLYLSGISNKLVQYSIKAKKTWLIVTIEAKYTVLTVIRKQACLSSNRLKANLTENGIETPDYNNCLKISIALAQCLTVINEIYGIVISGNLGCSNNKVRKMIFKPLEWSGIAINTKSASYLISKKSSALPILCINSNEKEAILNQLIPRL